LAHVLDEWSSGEATSMAIDGKKCWLDCVAL